MAERCGVPVRVPGVFTSTESDLGHSCVRVVGHEGPHRWQMRWETVPPEQVEAEIAAFDAGEGEEDEEKDASTQ